MKVSKGFNSTFNKISGDCSLVKHPSSPIKEPFLKKPLDVLFSFLGLVISFPICVLVAIAIYIEDGLPILFSQVRLGENGRKFKIYKFRSMIKNAERGTGPVWAYKKDHRVTRVGNFLRRTKLDELPQLFNILKGDMSFVGPRAERPEFVEEFRKIIPGFDYRLKIKPGLTGIAQVYGNYNTHPRNKLRYDRLYINNESFWLDLRLIFATIWYTIAFKWESRDRRIDKLIGQVILESGVITDEQLKEVLTYQEKWGGKIGEILIEKGYITEQKLKDFLNIQVSVNSAATWTAPSKKEYLLGEMMLAANVINNEQLQEALDYQKVTGSKIGRILIEKGYISEQALIDCLDRQSSVRAGG